MSAAGLLVGLILVAAAGYGVLMPVLRKSEDRAVIEAQADRREALLEERDAIYTAIRELDLDHQTGKITDEDYQARREQLVQQGVQVLKAIDAL